MKKFLTILAIVVPMGFLIGIGLWLHDIWSKISFKPYFVAADLNGISLKDIPAILAGEERFVNATIGMEVKNDSSTSLSFSGIKAKLFYNGVLIAETSDAFKNKKFTAAANNLDAPLQVIDNITLRVNKTVAQLLFDKITGLKPKIRYEVDLSVLGVPISKLFPIKSSFEW